MDLTKRARSRKVRLHEHVLEQWPVKEVAKTLGVSVAQVYLAKHRISILVQKEVKRLQSGLL